MGVGGIIVEGKIIQVNRYIGKSCRGENLESCALSPAGLDFDRSIVIANYDGQVLMQKRNKSELIDFRFYIFEETIFITYKNEVIYKIVTPINYQVLTTRAITLLKKDDTCVAFDLGDEIAKTVSCILDQQVRICYIHPEISKRQVDQKKTEGGKIFTYGNDGFPFLFTFLHSYEGFNNFLSWSLPSDRFRTNFFIKLDVDIDPFDEERAQKIVVPNKNISFTLTHPCSRCASITYDQKNGQQDSEKTVKQLAAYRKSLGLTGANFGMNAILRSFGEKNTIEKGDRIELFLKSS